MCFPWNWGPKLILGCLDLRLILSLALTRKLRLVLICCVGKRKFGEDCTDQYWFIWKTGKAGRREACDVDSVLIVTELHQTFP